MELSERVILNSGRLIEKSIGRELSSKYEMHYSYTTSDCILKRRSRKILG